MSPVYARQASISNLKRPESESRAAASTASGQPAVEVGDAPDGIATLALATPQRAREPGLACRARHGRTPSHRVGPGVDSDRHLTAAQVAHDAASGQCAGGSCSLSDLEGGYALRLSLRVAARSRHGPDETGRPALEGTMPGPVDVAS